MTLRSIHWIADSGLLVGLTTIGEFSAPAVLAGLSLSSVNFTLTVPGSGLILSASPGSTVIAAGLPVGLTINTISGWAYDGSGVAGSYSFILTETLAGSANSPRLTAITVTIATPIVTLDFSQSASSGLIAAIRSF